jgi:hypothetical protein
MMRILGAVGFVLLLASSLSQDDGAPSFTRVTAGALTQDRASTGGVSWVDFDDDGDLDLYVTNGYDVSAAEPSPQANRLYLNDGDGRFTSVTSGPLVSDSSYSSGSTWGDYDNDGDLDVFVSNQRGQDNALYRNDGAVGFTQLSGLPPTTDGGHSYSAGWVDVDSDGQLDLLVSNGGLSSVEPNFLYRNNGDGAFERIVEGPVVSDSSASGGAVWGDYDNDGDPDLFVANRVGPNDLYRNDGDWRFTKIEDGPIATDAFPSMAAAWGDYDNDGDLDLYVANIYGLANSLYRNNGDGSFESVRSGPHVVDGGHSYGVNWADYDRDGDLDLLVANWGAAPVLYRNRGDGEFERAAAGELGQTIAYASSLTWGDYDRDGDLDLYIGSWPNQPGDGEPNHLYRNEGTEFNWLAVRLRGTASNRSAIGARLWIQTRVDDSTLVQLREITAHTSWRSQNDLTAYFGLGPATAVERLTVRWPSGTVEHVADLPVNQTVEIVEGLGWQRR